jgi:hypothetical protein
LPAGDNVLKKALVVCRGNIGKRGMPEKLNIESAKESNDIGALTAEKRKSVTAAAAPL